MPEIWFEDVAGYEFYVTSNDGGHGVHFHIKRNNSYRLAKFVLTADGDVVVDSTTLDAKTTRKIQLYMRRNWNGFVQAWRSFFGNCHFDK
ncbi:DUF4160 domain-containing protein [Bifidobacterium imperatoris]|uniref:DUF4160 domain-containing protein n=1 Tax=Bifidobacterium imperatoris TaxID=2020965 RepID=A0A2N5IRU1_9BIFI|nr:DUF4160 domain-containing protein [Bifidobacterium imperatoris]PLS24673.1 hypothetical protein Tam1G_1261 [Bifidobacterium imperatoris]QSY57465.1 DUF4160 domain-containing protein [Bifidobacterium imperatoris]